MKKLNNVKWFVLGIAFSVLVMSLSIPALASNIKTAQLHYNDIKITLNGSQVTPVDANGTEVAPFIIDGTTYLPVRGIASALGCNVNWDGANNTVVLTNTPKTTNFEVYKLYVAGTYAQQAIGIYYQLSGLFASEIMAAGSSTYTRVLKEQYDDIFDSIIELNSTIKEENAYCKRNGYITAANYLDTLGSDVIARLTLACNVCFQSINGVSQTNVSNFNAYCNEALDYLDAVNYGINDDIFALTTK